MILKPKVCEETAAYLGSVEGIWERKLMVRKLNVLGPRQISEQLPRKEAAESPIGTPVLTVL